ncbi:hypothetical protein ACD591_11170 [Rufibacter glacialis]|uniref:STAS/SEC14 domain-containing protein n=1 Tax=Rufibacter glacialis TaxID=1259555 RepID=A0A5M8QA27_9BACT|nr:hypothetical protein [Rufibacter glacialis]KAA6431686.1 hypothetical protein FOE74_16325 [Rufibacter glacialis]GGK82449.1 hypothetical protein GCM10011405_32750 [Rufibacter glacialis]
MNEKLLANEPYLLIRYDLVNDSIQAEWLGEQTEVTVREGCEKILKFLTAHRCFKLLNDNTKVTGMWSDAAEWVALDWLPRMAKAGCRFLAHIYSPDIYAKLSADKAISFGVKGVMVATFQGKGAAEEWLRAV